MRSRIDNRLVGDRSSVEQVEIVFGGDEQLFDLTSYTTHIGRDTTGNLLSKGALLDRARTYMKGLITIEKTAVGTDSFLGRVRHEPLQGRPVGRHPEPRDRPAGLPAGHALELGRADRRGASSSTSSPAASRPTRRASSSCSGFLEPVVARVPLEATAGPAARAARGQVGRGDATPPRPPPDATTTSGRPVVRRIDLVAVDDVPEGTMKMAFVDGTDQVLVVNTNGEFHALQGVCSHEYFELDKGFLTAGTLTCALHLSRFDLENGEPLDPPADEPLAVYPVVIEDGRVLIEVPDGPLEISE